MVHRDIKPANIVLNEKMQVLLTDFGTAKRAVSSRTSNVSASAKSDVSYVSGLSNISAISGMSTNAKSNISRDSNDRIPLHETNEDFDELVGSEYYISPEMLESRQWSYASDLWALGIMIYQFFAGKVPFKGKSQDETFELIKKCEFNMTEDIPEDAADLISKILVKKPENRIGAQNLHDVMNHKFFAGVDFHTINTDLPPVKVELNKTQQVLIKYLPKSKQVQRPQLVKTQSQDFCQTPTNIPKNRLQSGLQMRKVKSTLPAEENKVSE